MVEQGDRTQESWKAMIGTAHLTVAYLQYVLYVHSTPLIDVEGV